VLAAVLAPRPFGLVALPVMPLAVLALERRRAPRQERV